MAKASDKAKEEKNPYDKDAVAKLFEDNYGPNLLHKLDVIKDQCEAGSFTLKRVSYYMKKIVGFVKTAAEASIKATNHEQEKKQRAEKDQMSDHLTGYQAIIDAMHQMFSMQLKWANDVQKEIVDRLGSYYRDFDSRRKKLIALEQKYLQKMEALAQKVKTERQNTLNAWQSLQEAEKAKEMADEEAQTAASNPKMVGKTEKKQLAKEEALRKQRIKTHKAFIKFEICVRDANDDQKHYYTKELPDLCKSFEMLELERMEELANRLVEFSRLQAELTTPLPGVTETIKKVVHVCDTKKCIKRFTKDCIDAYGKPPAVDPFVEGLPCTASLLEKDSPELTNLLQQDLKEVLASGKGPVRPASDKEHKAEEDFDLQDTQSPPDPEIVVVRAKFDFQQEDEDDIQFDPGDMIMITSPPTEYKKDEIGDEIKDGAWLQGVLMDSNHLDNAKPGSFPSNFVELAPVDADVTFRHFLEIPSGMRRFIAFLKTEFSQENMDFFYAVQEYRKADSDHVKRADDIVKKFVSEDADNMININSITKKQIEQALKTNTGVDRNLFNKAQKEIFELLSRDSFQRFKKTKSFHKYLEKRRKAELGKRFFSMDGGAQAHMRNPSSMFAVTGGLGSPSSPTSGASSTTSPSS